MDCLGILPYFVLQELAGLHTCEVIRSAPEEPVLVEKPKLLRRFQSSTERLIKGPPEASLFWPGGPISDSC